MIHSNHSIHNQQLDSRPDSTSLYSWQIWNITFSWTLCLFCTESVSPWFWASGQGVEKPMALWSWQALPKHSDVCLHSKWNIKIGVGAAGRDVKTSSIIFGTMPSGWVEFRSCESGMMNPSVVFGWRFGSVYIVMLCLQHCRQIVYRWATREALTPMRLVLSLYQSQAKTRRLHTDIPRVCVCVCVCVCVPAHLRFPGGTVPCSENQLPCRRHRFSPWVRKIPCRRKWKPTLVLSPGKSHGQRNLVGYSPWGAKKSDTAWQPNSIWEILYI